jgi:hypothetical protein
MLLSDKKGVGTVKIISLSNTEGEKCATDMINGAHSGTRAVHARHYNSHRSRGPNDRRNDNQGA